MSSPIVFIPYSFILMFSSLGQSKLFMYVFDDLLEQLFKPIWCGCGGGDGLPHIFFCSPPQKKRNNGKSGYFLLLFLTKNMKRCEVLFASMPLVARRRLEKKYILILISLTELEIGKIGRQTKPWACCFPSTCRIQFYLEKNNRFNCPSSSIPTYGTDWVTEWLMIINLRTN